MELIKKVIANHPQMSPQLILVHGNGKYDFKGSIGPHLDPTAHF